MGALCCCPCNAPEFENSILAHCICLRFFFLKLFSGRLDEHGATPLPSTLPQNDSMPHLRYSSPHCDSLVSRRDKNKFGLSEKALATKAGCGIEYLQLTSEDQDVCPTCLDEYTTENPKIVTKCCHHFHLGCIYEWLERSESCPICGQEMELCESP